MIDLSIIKYLVGENPTIWNWLAFIVELLLIGAFANYGVVWFYRRKGWDKNGKKIKDKETDK